MWCLIPIGLVIFLFVFSLCYTSKEAQEDADRMMRKIKDSK
jgi:hypothetical protein